MKVLVPLDGSRLADAALPHVRRLLQREPRAWDLHLLRAVDAADDARTEARAEARAHLLEVERLLEAEGFRVTTRVVVDDPVRAILEHVVEQRVDLVAMATHGRAGLQRWVRGSVAERVLHACPASLLLVNARGLSLAGDEVRYRSVLVAIDAATEPGCLAPAARLAASSGAAVVLLRVGEVGDRAERARALLAERGVAQVTLADAGGPLAAAVLAAARERAPDLIALATGPRSWLSPWPVGHAVAKVTRGAPCPVLLLRPERC